MYPSRFGAGKQGAPTTRCAGVCGMLCAPESDNLISVPEVSATDAARKFSDLLDAVEHRGEHFTIVRRGRVVAQLDPARSGKGTEVKAFLHGHRRDPAFARDVASARALLEVERRP